MPGYPGPFQGRVDALPQDEFDALASAVAARRCRELTGCGTSEEAALRYRPEWMS